MSKKIIYLLSLLMALSLVFASCKKTNGITGGDLPSQAPDTTKPPTDSVGENGLFTEQGELDKYAEKPIQGSKIAQYANNNYMRNPVITVVNGSTVVVFYEIRYESPGSENDTALTGTNVVDIAYTVSTDSGMSFDTSTDIKYVGKKAANKDESHGAPIVFYDKTNNKLVVVASAGIGLGVGSESIGSSRLEYAVADVTDGNVGAFSSWKKIDNITTTGIGGDFKQFGTHSARGVVTSGNKLLLPVTVAKFINQDGSWGQSQWGYVLYEGSTSDNGSTYTFTKKGSAVKMNLAHNTKATRIVKADSSDNFISLTVNDNKSNLRLYQAKNAIASGAGNPAVTSIVAGDGAAGTLVVDKWVGGSYNPSEYAKGSSGNVQGQEQCLLSHVLELEKKLAIRKVDNNFTAQVGGNFIPDSVYSENSKSSSLDILKDGTIVMVAEGGKVATTDKLPDHARPFFIHFYRYSQAYIVNQTK